MPIDEVHLRHCILCEFQKGNVVSDRTKNLCTVFESNVVDIRTMQSLKMGTLAWNMNLDTILRKSMM